VQQRPQRPFVPHRTPKASPQLVSRSEFRLARPFVPGSSSEVVEAMEQLPPIEVFLDTSPQYAESQFTERAGDYSSEFAEDHHEPPPIEHFLDPLPAVASFAPDADGALIDESPRPIEYTSAEPKARTAAEAGWVEDDWQRYDWRAAAALGDGVEAVASNEWAKTDWDIGAPAQRGERPTAAQAIASALDQIARRIREGELRVPPPGALTDPAAIAATLAALMGVRR
jgi:hypothetical protein